MTNINEIVIPEIQTINIPIFVPSTSNSLNVPLPNINLPGCVKSHRDAKPSNTAIVEDDVNGSFYSCPPGYQIPSYVPIEYNPKKIRNSRTKTRTKTCTKSSRKEV